MSLMGHRDRVEPTAGPAVSAMPAHHAAARVVGITGQRREYEIRDVR
jgi:hypothetical protein